MKRTTIGLCALLAWTALPLAADNAPNLVFTRATAAAGASDAVKDTTVTDELGSGYRAASLLEVAAHTAIARILRDQASTAAPTTTDRKTALSRVKSMK